MRIESLDHLVLTTPDITKIVEFYTRVLGMEMIEFGDGRIALEFGYQKINLHLVGNELSPHAGNPTAGSLDLCFITKTT